MVEREDRRRQVRHQGALEAQSHQGIPDNQAISPPASLAH
jgi:hypothetical protein